MEKRKRTKRELREQARREAENTPIVRQLRDLYERGMADLERRGEVQGRPTLRELYERGMADLETRRETGQQA